MTTTRGAEFCERRGRSDRSGRMSSAVGQGLVAPTGPPLSGSTSAACTCTGPSARTQEARPLGPGSGRPI